MFVCRSRRQNGFTLVELLVVIGIIAVLIGMLLPALSKVQQQSKWLKCQSNLRTVGQYLQMYSMQWRGYCYPPQLGADKPIDRRWPVFVFKQITGQPPMYNPPVMYCPSDDPSPMAEHSYILNDHIFERGMKFGSRPPLGMSSSDIVLMGEKVTDQPDYYMNENGNGQSDYDAGKVELYRHGLRLGSNYLYLDLHVGPFRFNNRNQMQNNVDPWDPAPTVPTSPPPTT